MWGKIKCFSEKLVKLDAKFCPNLNTKVTRLENISLLIKKAKVANMARMARMVWMARLIRMASSYGGMNPECKWRRQRWKGCGSLMCGVLIPCAGARHSPMAGVLDCIQSQSNKNKNKKNNNNNNNKNSNNTNTNTWSNDTNNNHNISVKKGVMPIPCADACHSCAKLLCGSLVMICRKRRWTVITFEVNSWLKVKGIENRPIIKYR